MFRLPMLGFSCLSFLMILVIIAIATWLVFRSQEPDKTKLSGCAGCAIGFALLLIAGLGALGCTVVAVLSAPAEMLRHGPIERFELHWPQEDHKRSAEPGDDVGSSAEPQRYPARLTLTLRDSGRATEIAGEIASWLREATDEDLAVHITSETTDSGAVTRLEFSLPIERAELAELRDELQRELPKLRIPERLEVEFKDD